MNRFALLALIAVSITGTTASGSVPPLVNYSGTLTNPVGDPQVGTFSVTFSIYSVPSGGIALWTETQSLTTNAEGLFNVLLGTNTPLTESVFDDPDRYLGTTVSPDPEMVPRTRFSSVPYAFRTATVDGATGGQMSGNVTTTGIAEGLRIQGPATGNANEAYLRFVDQLGASSGWVGDGHPGNRDIYLLSNTGSVRIWTAAGEVLMASAAGNVGIGADPDTGTQLLVSTSGSTAIEAITSFGSGVGVLAVANGINSEAVWGGSSAGYAGYFNGKVNVNGTLTKTAGSFKIDHPLDPANKYLSHSFVESPDMMNIYNGNVTLDARGEALVELPEWFGALNRDFRYQLTAIGAPGPNLHVSHKVTNNQFRIAGGSKGMEVSWQVTGIRQDAYAIAHRIPVEEVKPSAERGHYRNPELFGQPEEKHIDWARHPKMMKQMKAEREKAKAESAGAGE